MLKLINSLRDKIISTLAYVRMYEHENPELEHERKVSDDELSAALIEIGEYLDSHKKN